MNPAIVFLLLLIGIPLFEVYLLIEVGSEIGAIPTISLTVFTAVLGGLLVRTQGFVTTMKVRRAMDRGETPAIEMLGGMLLLMAGLLLLLPGFLTDLVGFLLLVPAVRQYLVLAFLKHSKVMHPAGEGTPQGPPGQRIIEGEYRREDH